MAFKQASNLTAKLLELDKFLSDRIHSMTLPFVAQIWVCFWGIVFNREGNLVVLAIVASVFPLYMD